MSANQLPAHDLMRSGCYLPDGSLKTSERVVVVARDIDDAGIADLAESVADLQLLRWNFRPVFLVGQVNTIPLSRFKFQFETVMDEDMLALIHPDLSMDAYWRERIAEMLRVYDPHRTVHVHAGRPVESWMFP